MKTFVTVAFTLIFALQAYAGKIDGTWKGVMKSPDGNQEFGIAMTFKADGDKLTGAIQTPQGDIAISKGKILSDTTFSFELEFNGMVMKNNGTFQDDDTIALKAEDMPAGPDGQEMPALILKRQK